MSGKNEANAVGGKTARACDNCVRKRARWYCAADDAFLCQSCDSSVHFANPLARRHQRVLLKAASSLKQVDVKDVENLAPSWHGGFKRKARTPRHGKFAGPPKSEEPSPRQMISLVPDLGTDETSQEENEEEQLLYRVPIYNPFTAELRSSSNSPSLGKDEEVKALLAGYGQDEDNLDLFLPSDVDLTEFAADVESLLAGGECSGMEGLGLLMECKEEEYFGKVKLEVDHMACYGGDADVDFAREAFELDFDYDSPAEEKVAAAVKSGDFDCGFVKKKRKILLNLDYESVILEWATQGSPWTTGIRPVFDSGECWPDCMGIFGSEVHNDAHRVMSQHLAAAAGDGGREARVTRYREKRRTRLFSKKIRYEVRKLNAEKRPRMKGRFVKRSSFGIGSTAVGSALPLLNH